MYVSRLIQKIIKLVISTRIIRITHEHIRINTNYKFRFFLFNILLLYHLNALRSTIINIQSSKMQKSITDRFNTEYVDKEITFFKHILSEQ